MPTRLLWSLLLITLLGLGSCRTFRVVYSERLVGPVPEPVVAEGDFSFSTDDAITLGDPRTRVDHLQASMAQSQVNLFSGNHRSFFIDATLNSVPSFRCQWTYSYFTGSAHSARVFPTLLPEGLTLSALEMNDFDNQLELPFIFAKGSWRGEPITIWATRRNGRTVPEGRLSVFGLSELLWSGQRFQVTGRDGRLLGEIENRDQPFFFSPEDSRGHHYRIAGGVPPEAIDSLKQVLAVVVVLRGFIDVARLNRLTKSSDPPVGGYPEVEDVWTPEMYQ